MLLSRSAPRTLHIRLVRHPQAVYNPRRQFAIRDYDGDTGNPKGKEPNKQGPNPSADREHPGPPVPKQGYGSGSTSTKGTEKGHNTSQKQQGQKRSFSTLAGWQFNRDQVNFSDGGMDSRPKSTKGLSPKILNDSPPPEDKAPEDVKKHNEELRHRAERAHEKVSNGDAEKDKVGKGFWSGEFALGAVVYATVGAIVALLIEYW